MMKKWTWFFGGLAGLVLLDQLVKLWVLNDLKPGGPIVLIPRVLEFLYVENRGAAFGILQNRQWLFVVITAIVLLGVIRLYPRIPEGRHFLPLRLCAVFISAGAVGNVIDRLCRSFVVDFIYFKLIDFPVFNVADIYVTCSAFALIFLFLFFYKEEEIAPIFPGSHKG